MEAASSFHKAVRRNFAEHVLNVIVIDLIEDLRFGCGRRNAVYANVFFSEFFPEGFSEGNDSGLCNAVGSFV